MDLRSKLFAELKAKKPAVQQDPSLQKEYAFPGLDITLRIQEDPLGGVGGSIWEACYDLLNYVKNDVSAPSVKGKRLLELGAGTGIVSIIFALMGAEVTSTDRQEVLDLLQLNVNMNTDTKKHNIKVAELNWGEGVEKFNPPVDFIVASECIYNLRYGDLLLNTIRALSGPETAVLFAYAERQPEEEAKFLDTVREYYDIVSLPSSDPRHKVLRFSLKQ